MPLVDNLATDDNYPGLFEWLDSIEVVALDTETNGLQAYGTRENQLGNRLVGISLYHYDYERQDEEDYDGDGIYLPFRHGAGFNLSQKLLRRLVQYLSDRVNAGTLKLLTWNGKFDLHMLHVDGFQLPLTDVEDGMIAAHLLNENEPTFGLKALADKYLSNLSSKDEDDLRVEVEERYGSFGSKAWKGHMWRLPYEVVYDYAVADVYLTWKMAELYQQGLEDWGMVDLYREWCDYELLLTRMEAGGITLDVDAIHSHMAESAPALAKTTGFLQEEARKRLEAMPEPPRKTPGGNSLNSLWKVWNDYWKFNPGSWSQLQQVFDWDQTAKDFLEAFDESDPQYPIAQAVLDYRVLSKMNGTYYDAYLSLIDRHNVLRPNYNPIGTVNGRLSCNRPNIQNVPRYSPRRKVKDVYIPSDPDVYSLLETDYAQAELRIACHFAKEKLMTEILLEGRDPHSETAERMGVPRFIGKTLNFAVLYGAGVRALTKLLKCTEPEARDYLDGYLALYPGFRRLSEQTEAFALKYGYIKMPSGRYRHFNGWASETRKAMNSYVQGTASEMLRVGMQRIDRTIREERIDARLLFQVHDSIMIEVADTDIERLLPFLRRDLTDFPYNPPPDIDSNIGKRWGQLQPIAV